MSELGMWAEQHVKRARGPRHLERARASCQGARRSDAVHAEASSNESFRYSCKMKNNTHFSVAARYSPPNHPASLPSI